MAFLHWNIMKLYTTYRNNTNINNLGLSQIVISLLHVQFKEKVPNCLTGKLYNVVEIMEPHHEMRWMHIHYIQLCQEYENFHEHFWYICGISDSKCSFLNNCNMKLSLGFHCIFGIKFLTKRNNWSSVKHCILFLLQDI